MKRPRARSHQRAAHECGGWRAGRTHHDLTKEESKMQPDEFFGEVISVYTDEDALADGTLIDITPLGVRFREMPINRITCGLWHDFLPFCAANRAAAQLEMNPQALARTMNAKLALAIFQGGIWTLPPRLWLIENEVGGWTVMRPEDY
jgi:hypothetical protein